MNRQEQIEEMAKDSFYIHHFPGQYKSNLSWETCSQDVRDWHRNNAIGLIAKGYAKATPLVALDEDKVRTIIESFRKGLWTIATKERFSLSEYYESRIPTCVNRLLELGSPVARIPSEEQIKHTIDNLEELKHCADINESKVIATAIRKLCEYLNKGE